MDDELDKRCVDDLAHSRTGSQKVTEGQQRPHQHHAQNRQDLQACVLAAVARHLTKPHRVQELLTVGLGNKLYRLKYEKMDKKKEIYLVLLYKIKVDILTMFGNWLKG